MAFVGFRVPKELFEQLDKIAKENGTSKSAIVRSAVGRYVTSYSYEDVTTNWKPLLWKILDLDIAQINHALQFSATVEEFFSYMNRWCKKYRLTTFVSQDGIMTLRLLDDKNGMDIRVQHSALEPKLMVISNLSTQLHYRILEYTVGTV
jgi:hypothetical protein